MSTYWTAAVLNTDVTLLDLLPLCATLLSLYCTAVATVLACRGLGVKVISGAQCCGTHTEH
jgi:hypothetical protein